MVRASTTGMTRASLLVCVVAAACARHADTAAPEEPVAAPVVQPDEPAPVAAPTEPAPAAAPQPEPTASASIPVAEPEDAAEAPAAATPAAETPAAPPPLVEDANLIVGSITADGLELRELACAVDGGMPLFGTLMIAGTIAKQKKAIDRCAPGGAAFVVTWTFAGGKVKSPTATGGTDKQGACIAKAFARVAAPLDARCGAVVLAGDGAKASAAADVLRGTNR